MQHNGRECIGVNSDYSLSAYKNQTFSIDESRTEFIRAMPKREKMHEYKQCNNPIKKTGKYLYIRFLWFNLQVQSKKRFCAYKTDVLLTRLITG